MNSAQQLYYARLYTDKKFRQQEFQSTHFTLKEKEDILFFAQSLINKRRGVVLGMLSQSKKNLGDSFTIYFQEYAECTPMKRGVHKHLWDTYAFLRYIDKMSTDPELKKAINFDLEKILYNLPPSVYLYLNHSFYYLLRLIRIFFYR